MEGQKLFNWMQVLTGLALLIGLALVIVELRQAKQMAITDHYNKAFESYLDVNLAIMGENPAAVVAKSCLTPEALSPEEEIVMTSLYRSRLWYIQAMVAVQELGDFDLDLNTFSQGMVRFFMSSDHSRAWFADNVSDPDLVALAARVSAADRDCRRFWSLGED